MVFKAYSVSYRKLPAEKKSPWLSWTSVRRPVVHTNHKGSQLWLTHCTEIVVEGLARRTWGLC